MLKPGANNVPRYESLKDERNSKGTEKMIRSGDVNRRLKCNSPVLLFLGLLVCVLILILHFNIPTDENISAETKSVKQSKSKSKNSKPHVVFLLVDDFGFNDIGYHGSKIKTPVMDTLAKDGVILENYYVQPKCSPTRSQLLSGRYQIHTGLQHGTIKHNVPNCLPLDEETLPQSLKKLGYATHMVGKWHLGFYRKACLPTRRGFDSFFGLLLGSGGHWSHERDGGYDFRVNENVAKQYKNKYSTILFAKQARKIIMSHKPEKPLFLYVPFQAVHTPLEVPSRYSLPYKNVFQDRTRQIYAGMVTCVDEAIGNITNALKEKGIYQNSVIILSTDNGAQVHSSGGSNWPLRGMKGTLWEGGIRAVGFVHSRLIPKSVRGTVNRHLAHVSDWFPTIVEGIAKGKYRGAKPLDGYNIWESIKQNKPSPRKEILHNIDSLRAPIPPTGRWNKRSIQKIFDISQRAAIRSGHWKLITGTNNRYGWYAPPGAHQKSVIPVRNPGKVLWLFNITADPYEKRDLSTKHPDVVIKLLTKLAKYNKTAVHVKYPPPDPAADPSKHGGIWEPWAKRPPKGFKGIYGPVCSKGHSASCIQSLKNIDDHYNQVEKEKEIVKPQPLKLKIKETLQKVNLPNKKHSSKPKHLPKRKPHRKNMPKRKNIRRKKTITKTK
ncbi:arylsulfatase B-like [Anneissia japonica]|uniref:arylsulfatase B-like n=1 Tax=Anneissia japonica TaxID=1529436 RepID=UPI0014257590|nr:arylsulfatase B-like [Anneissia japonica]